MNPWNLDLDLDLDVNAHGVHAILDDRVERAIIMFTDIMLVYWPTPIDFGSISPERDGLTASWDRQQHRDVVELVWCANGERSLYRPQAVQPVQARFPRHFAAHPAQDARRAVGQATERPSMRSRARSRASSFVKVPVLVL